MDSTISQFIAIHRVCSLTTLLPEGSPHAAALHYSHQDNPLTFCFSTEKSSKKCQNLLDGKSSKASVVIGFSEEEWKTLQMDGEIRAIRDPDELKKIKAIHYIKHPDSKQYENDPETLFLSFTPHWWRYTDYNTDPPLIKTSE